MSTLDPDEETGNETSTRHMPLVNRSGTEMSGDLAEVPLEDVLTTIFCARSTGTLRVEASGDLPSGELVLWKGEVLACSTGSVTGDAAVLALLERAQGRFDFSEELEPCDQNVKRPLMELVDEVARKRRKR